jgi:hypothetical protein
MQDLCDFSNKKSKRHLLIGDQHKTIHPEGLVFTRMDELSYDLELMGPGAGHKEKQKAPAYLIGDQHKTSHPERLEWNNQYKKSQSETGFLYILIAGLIVQQVARTLIDKSRSCLSSLLLSHLEKRSTCTTLDKPFSFSLFPGFQVQELLLQFVLHCGQLLFCLVTFCPAFLLNAQGFF